jgi:hypothetical protein
MTSEQSIDEEVVSQASSIEDSLAKGDTTLDDFDADMTYFDDEDSPDTRSSEVHEMTGDSASQDEKEACLSVVDVITPSHESGVKSHSEDLRSEIDQFSSAAQIDQAASTTTETKPEAPPLIDTIADPLAAVEAEDTSMEFISNENTSAVEPATAEAPSKSTSPLVKAEEEVTAPLADIAEAPSPTPASEQQGPENAPAPIKKEFSVAHKEYLEPDPDVHLYFKGETHVKLCCRKALSRPSPYFKAQIEAWRETTKNTFPIVLHVDIEHDSLPGKALTGLLKLAHKASDDASDPVIPPRPTIQALAPLVTITTQFELHALLQQYVRKLLQPLVDSNAFARYDPRFLLVSGNLGQAKTFVQCLKGAVMLATVAPGGGAADPKSVLFDEVRAELVPDVQVKYEHDATKSETTAGLPSTNIMSEFLYLQQASASKSYPLAETILEMRQQIVDHVFVSIYKKLGEYIPKDRKDLIPDNPSCKEQIDHKNDGKLCNHVYKGSYLEALFKTGLWEYNPTKSLAYRRSIQDLRMMLVEVQKTIEDSPRIYRGNYTPTAKSKAPGKGSKGPTHEDCFHADWLPALVDDELRRAVRLTRAETTFMAAQRKKFHVGDIA